MNMGGASYAPPFFLLNRTQCNIQSTLSISATDYGDARPVAKTAVRNIPGDFDSQIPPRCRLFLWM